MIRIKYLNKDLEKLVQHGDWIDLRVSDVKIWELKEGVTEDYRKDKLHSFGSITYKGGDRILFGLGVAMELPKGYEAVVVPRSSTFENYGLIQANHFGVIDNAYCGDDDEWLFNAIALKDGEIKMNDRICQFRIQKIQPKIEFEEVDNLGNDNRGGFGSTGVR